MNAAEDSLQTVVPPSVVSWRTAQLRAAGCPRLEAGRLAERPDVDLHVAVDLLRRGCPPELALRILL